MSERADVPRRRVSVTAGVLKAILEQHKRGGSGGWKSPSGVQGRSPGRGSGGRSPPEAETHRHLL